MEPSSTPRTFEAKAEDLLSLPEHTVSRHEGRAFLEITQERDGVPENVRHISEEALSEAQKTTPKPIDPESVNVMEVGDNVDLDGFGLEDKSQPPSDSAERGEASALPLPVGPEPSPNVVKAGANTNLDVFGSEEAPLNPPDEAGIFKDSETPHRGRATPSPQELQISDFRAPNINVEKVVAFTPLTPPTVMEAAQQGNAESTHLARQGATYDAVMRFAELQVTKAAQQGNTESTHLARQGATYVIAMLLEESEKWASNRTPLEKAAVIIATNLIHNATMADQQSLGISHKNFHLKNNIDFSLMNGELLVRKPCAVEARDTMTKEILALIRDDDSISFEDKTLLLKLIDEGNLIFLNEGETAKAERLGERMAQELIQLYENLVAKYLIKIEQIRSEKSKATHGLNAQAASDVEKKHERKSNQVHESVLAKEIASQVLLFEGSNERKKAEEVSTHSRMEHDRTVQDAKKRRRQSRKKLQDRIEHDEKKFAQRQSEIQKSP